MYDACRYKDDDNESVNFYLFSKFDPIYFEDDVKKIEWCDSVDE